MIRPGRRLGAILVEMEAIESEELSPAVEHQVKDLLLDLFTWTQRRLRVRHEGRRPEAAWSLSISLENLILEGLRRSRSWSQILPRLGDIDVGPGPHRQHASCSTSSS